MGGVFYKIQIIAETHRWSWPSDLAKKVLFVVGESS